MRMTALKVEERKRVQLNSDTRTVLLESLRLAEALVSATIVETQRRGKKKERARLHRLLERQQEIEREIRDVDNILVIK